MIIKLTTAGKHETIYVNFNYVRTIRKDNSFTELVMSDDKYHKLAVTETPEEIYEMLYPSCLNSDSVTISANALDEEKIPIETPVAVKKSTAKKAVAKSEEWIWVKSRAVLGSAFAALKIKQL